MTDSIEHRVYVIRGELRPEQWALLVGQLGGIGVNSWPTEAYDGQRTPESLHPLVAEKYDFIRFGESTTYGSKTAGRAWHKLTALYAQKIFSDAYEHYPNFDAELVKALPIEFQDVPDQVPINAAPGTGISGLRMESMLPLLAQIDEAQKCYGEREGVRRVLGRMAGMVTADFLRDFSQQWFSGTPEVENLE